MASATELKKDFKKIADRDGLVHSYLFFGHESAAEQLAFAKELSNYFERKKWASPEKLLMDSMTITTREDGGIDLVRAAIRFLWQKPVVSPKRTLIIDRADHLTLPAQQALLKITEEPPPHALILLLTRNPDTLLPAVQSRFQKIFFAATSQGAVSENKTAKEFLRASAVKRKEMLKEITEGPLEEFIAGLITELRRDKMKNWKTIREILGRWALINQFNLNKKLQIEAMLINNG